MTEYSLRAKLITEFIGTFFLTLTICLAVVFESSHKDLAPFAIASTLMVMIYAGGHVSGAHYNPAVTISIYLRGASEKSEIAPYIASQLVAASMSAAIASNLFMHGDPGGEELAMETIPALAAELMFTFALVYVILNVATSESTEGNGYYGASIALVVLAGALTVGSISGASFNPAVSVSLILTGSLTLADSWLHFAPQLAGGILASYVFKAQHN
tara:strand:- start:325 stop:969 length:645 start_codon:yes stop_codon:yes gene_type:complete